jgi:AraC-like DNA-binding protein
MFAFLNVRSVVSGAFAVAGPWVTRSAIQDDLKFIALVRGGASLRTDGIADPIAMAAGDIVLLNGRTRLALSGGEGDGNPAEVAPPDGGVIDPKALAAAGVSVVIGGRVELSTVARDFLLRTLPPVSHVRAAAEGTNRVRRHIENLLEEITAQRIGSDFAVRQYAQLLILDVVRVFSEDPGLPAGWLKGLADPQLRSAIMLIHDEPARRWTLESLARSCAMSRTAFAERFRACVGIPPVAYLIRWRMLLAKQALTDPDTRVAPLAYELGYGSESAFSAAFKKQEGLAPSEYRARATARAKAA